MTKQQEWDEWMKQMNLPGWLERNPGKTEADYDLERQRNNLKSQQESYKQEQIRQQNVIDQAAYKTAIWIIFIINWLGIPSLIAWGTGFVSNADFFPRFIFGFVIVLVLRLLGVWKGP